MKQRKVILVLLAFVIGVSGAIGSSLYLSDVYVKGRLLQGGQVHCINTLKQCQSNGTNLCIVIVPTTANGSSVVATTSSTYRTYASDCEFILTNSTNNALFSDVQTYELMSN